mmetsp:Transcript_98248/g.155397  ORF Transcript_98248/g.155397 Transcript_98248/m.155397 type:complete len:149 (+) Transcript_98248:876-1322(+)
MAEAQIMEELTQRLALRADKEVKPLCRSTTAVPPVEQSHPCPTRRAPRAPETVVRKRLECREEAMWTGCILEEIAEACGVVAAKPRQSRPRERRWDEETVLQVQVRRGVVAHRLEQVEHSTAFGFEVHRSPIWDLRFQVKPAMRLFSK